MAAVSVGDGWLALVCRRVGSCVGICAGGLAGAGGPLHLLPYSWPATGHAVDGARGEVVPEGSMAHGGWGGGTARSLRERYMDPVGGLEQFQQSLQPCASGNKGQLPCARLAGHNAVEQRAHGRGHCPVSKGAGD